MTDAPAWQRALFERRAHGVKLDLEAVRAGFAALGRPAGDVPAIHVVGTNGKGSTAAMCSHALVRHGRRVGLFTSPHLHRVGERVRVDGRALTDDELRVHVERVLSLETCRGALPRALTFFEVITLAAMVAFAERGVDALVLEAGMGGRLDATRVGDARVVAITSIGLDHRAYLGDTLAAIAGEKAAVMRPDVPAFCAPQPVEVREVLERVARERGAPLRWVEPLERAPRGLVGDHQRINGALALACVRRWVPAVQPSALDGVRWAGRLERLAHGGGALVFDVAHNLEGVRALVAYAGAQPRPASGRVFVFGCMADKDAAGMLDALAGLGDTIWVTRSDTAGAQDPRALAALRPSRSLRVFTSIDSDAFRTAWTQALERGAELWVCGSTFLVGALRARVRPVARDPIELRDPLQRDRLERG